MPTVLPSRTPGCTPDSAGAEHVAIPLRRSPRTSRRFLFCGLGLLAFLAGLGLYLLSVSSQQSRVTEENFDRIHSGMTRVEIDALLGDATNETLVAAENAKVTWLAAKKLPIT